MLQPSDPPQLVSSSTSSSAGQTESSRQLPQQAQYPYHYQQQVQYGHHVVPPQQSYGPGSIAEPAYGVQGAEQLQGNGGQSSQRSTQVRPSPWKWVSMREVIFVFLVCSIGAALFRVRDTAVFQLAWEETLNPLHYKNGKFPLTSEKLPTPIVTDMDSDALADILMLTYDAKLKLVNTPVLKHPFKTTTTIPTVTQKFEVDLAEISDVNIRPVAMATGFLRPYQSMVQVRHQVVALLMSDWSVLCLDHQLKLLWKTLPLKTAAEDHSIV